MEHFKLSLSDLESFKREAQTWNKNTINASMKGREDIEEHTRQFIAEGGIINKIPIGATNFTPTKQLIISPSKK